MSEQTFEVTGMTCGHCVMTVTQAISEVPGITAVQVELATGEAQVRGDNIDEKAVRTAVAEAGYGTH